MLNLPTIMPVGPESDTFDQRSSKPSVLEGRSVSGDPTK